MGAAVCDTEAVDSCPYDYLFHFERNFTWCRQRMGLKNDHFHPWSRLDWAALQFREKRHQATPLPHLNMSVVPKVNFQGFR